MKRSEIKVGEEYASTRNRDWMQWLSCSRVRVVDLGPFAQTSTFGRPRPEDLGMIDGTPTKAAYRRDAKGTYVAVREYDRDGALSEQIYFHPNSYLKATWREHLKVAAEVRAARAEARSREQERAEADRTERAELDQIAARAGVALDFITRPGKVTISRADLRRLLEAALVRES